MSEFDIAEFETAPSRKPASLPRMTPSEIRARAKAKEELLLDFLASGEVWTTASIAGRLLCISSRRARALLDRMVRDGLLKSVVFERGVGRPGRVFGITATGLAFSSHPAADACPRFESLPSPLFAMHHLDTQVARLQAEAAGWREWIPGKSLYSAGFRKIPDALAITPGGRRVAIEIERTIKTPLRYSQIIPDALRDIKEGRYERVVYVSPQGRADAVERALRRVEIVKVLGEPVRLTESHRARFEFVNLFEFPCGLSFEESTR